MTTPVVISVDSYLTDISELAKEAARTSDSRTKGECIALLCRQINRLQQLSNVVCDIRKPVQMERRDETYVSRYHG
jgi:hypothetical protein